MLDTTGIDEKTRKWLPLQMNGLAECPVWRGDVLVPHEEIISTMEQLIVGFRNSIGVGKSGNFTVGFFEYLIHVEARVSGLLLLFKSNT